MANKTINQLTSLGTVDANDEFVLYDVSEGATKKATKSTLLNGMQTELTFDDTPTEGSNNPVKSSGVAQAIANYTLKNYINVNGTTDSNGLLDLSSIGNFIPILAKNFSLITTFFNGSTLHYYPYVRITNYDGTPYANQSVSMQLYVIPISNE